MPIINLTKLTIRLADDNDEVYETFEPGDDSLVVHTRGEEREVDGIPVALTRVTRIDGLPEPAEDTYYIVPQPVAYVSNRPDLVTPDTGPTAIRDDDGTVYAVRRLYSVSSS